MSITLMQYHAPCWYPSKRPHRNSTEPLVVAGSQIIIARRSHTCTCLRACACPSPSDLDSSETFSRVALTTTAIAIMACRHKQSRRVSHLSSSPGKFLRQMHPRREPCRAMSLTASRKCKKRQRGCPHHSTNDPCAWFTAILRFLSILSFRFSIGGRRAGASRASSSQIPTR